MQQLDGLRVDRAHQLPLVLAGALHELGLLLVLLTADAVVALVLARVDVAVVVELLQEFLDVALVPLVGGADEVVVRDVDRGEQRLPRLVDELVGPLLRRHAVRGRGAQDLLAVLVGAREHPRVVAGLAVPSREHVGCHLGVGVPDVGHVIHVENGRGDVERGAVGHTCNPMGERMTLLDR